MGVAMAPVLHAQEPQPPQAQAPLPPAPASAPAPQAAPQEAHPAEPEQPAQTPVRLSMTDGEVSFWRPGSEDWTQARVNTPLMAGDALYAAPGATLELQVGPFAWVRASGDTELTLENLERDFLQLRVASGHLSLDVRRLTDGQKIELNAPNAAFSIANSGYYRIDVADDTTTFVTRRDGRATMTSPQGEALAIAASEEVVVQGADNPRVETYVAPDLDAWDRWNYARTDHFVDSVSARYVNPNVYGIDDLDHSGTWRVSTDYGPVWVPTAVAPGWAPYSAGRWVWGPHYGWAWVDDAPWGWAPFHYGRWVYWSGFWAWAPGPVVAVPVYAPALVAFFGGPHFGVSIGLGAPAIGWLALGWGEPCVPWWGPPGFIGVPWWGGWGGPRIVNNVVINRTTVVNANTINVWRNATVRNAVVAARLDQFGRGFTAHVRVPQFDQHQLEPLHGKLPVEPVAASLTPALARAARPPEAALNRSVVATRAPYNPAPALSAAGLKATAKPPAAQRLVSAPQGPHPAFAAPRPPFGQQSKSERQPPPPPPRFGRTEMGEPHRVEPSHVPSLPSRQPGGGQHAAPPPPPLERHAPTAQQLPGEPANRVYRSQPLGHPPSQPPAHVPQHSAAPQHAVGPAPHAAPHGGPR
jgi:hypothetical protein